MTGGGGGVEIGLGSWSSEGGLSPKSNSSESELLSISIENDVIAMLVALRYKIW